MEDSDTETDVFCLLLTTHVCAFWVDAPGETPGFECPDVPYRAGLGLGRFRHGPFWLRTVPAIKPRSVD